MNSNHSFENELNYKLFANKSYKQKEDLALNNPQGLIYHNQPIDNGISFEKSKIHLFSGVFP